MKRLYEDSLNLQGYQALDIAVFIKNLKSEYLWANDFFIQKSAGYHSVNEIYRKEDHHFIWRDYADSLRTNDKLLIELKQSLTMKEQIVRCDGNFITTLSKKSPIFNKRNKIVGLIGFCLEFPLSAISKLLSKREYAIITLLAQGYTDKEIGKKLNISPRTVEAHVNNAKSKLNVSTRAELIVKFLA